ncbi:MAG: NUDIX domain-containing protein [Phycisphaerales bacterium]|nr:NUDIX domain-containing protein [Phycisphaerales bacterium]
MRRVSGGRQRESEREREKEAVARAARHLRSGPILLHVHGHFARSTLRRDHRLPLPYRIATLVDLRDARGRFLLLRRKKAPNQGLCSPIGGKLDMPSGESPAACARRETLEEVGLDIPIERFHLLGLISETAFEGRGHWLIFYYRVKGSVEFTPTETPDGWLDWHEPQEIDKLPIPETDRRIIWPLVLKHDPPPHGENPGFFAVHIDCTGPEGTDLAIRVEQG